MTPPAGRVRRFAICFSAVGTLFLGELRFWTSPENRFFYFWERSESALLAAVILLLAAIVFVVVSRTYRRSHGWRIVWQAGLVYVMVNAALAVIVRLGETPGFLQQWAVPLLAYALVAGAMLWWRERMYRISAGACLILSPLVPVTLLQLSTAPGVDLRERVPATRDSSAQGPPIIILVFDGWSYARSVDSTGYLASQPNVRALALHATDFRAAYSPWWETLKSFRAIFAQSTEAVSISDQKWWYPNRGLEWDGPSTLLRRARGAGYDSRIVGYYLPYREMVGDAANVVVTEPHWPGRSSFAVKTGWILLRALQFQGDPLVRWLGSSVENSQFNKYWYEMNLRIEGRVTSELQQMRNGRILIAHFPLPHSPFVFLADGSPRGDDIGERLEYSPIKYLAHLQYMDRVIGRLVGSLKASGVYDRALLIVTSDHSWKVDSLTLQSMGLQERRHVPFLVKYPGQDSSLMIDERFCLAGLAVLLDRAYGSDSAKAPTQEDSQRLAQRSCLERGSRG